jgi:hypothetical protein
MHRVNHIEERIEEKERHNFMKEAVRRHKESIKFLIKN